MNEMCVAPGHARQPLCHHHIFLIQPFNQPFNHPVSQPASQLTNQPPTNHHTNQPTYQPTHKSMSQRDSASERVNDPNSYWVNASYQINSGQH